MRPGAVGIALAFVCGAALAQAPFIERKSGASAYDQAQRDVEFTRRYADEADGRVRRAERAAKEAAAARKSAEKAAADARGRDEQAQRYLGEVREAAAQARAAHERAVAEFERIRKAGQ